MKSYSQFEEDKTIAKYLEARKLNFFVDIGAHDGETFSNTKFLKDLGIPGLMFDAREYPHIIQKKFTAENINEILELYSTPKRFSLLSIDVDGNDYWLWKALNYEPKVVVIEYNPRAEDGYIHPYDPEFLFDREKGMEFDGSSRLALTLLAEEKGYKLLDYTPANLIFVKQ